MSDTCMIDVNWEASSNGHCSCSTWLSSHIHLRVSFDDKTCTNLLSRKNATSCTAGLRHIQTHESFLNMKEGQYSLAVQVPERSCVASGSSNNTCQNPPLVVDCMQTLPFSSISNMLPIQMLHVKRPSCIF